MKPGKALREFAREPGADETGAAFERAFTKAVPPKVSGYSRYDPLPLYGEEIKL